MAAQVEQLLLKAEGAHEAFRLWVTAEPHPAFPIGLLQMGIKITNEAPVGIRAGLRASYQWITQACLSRSYSEQCSSVEQRDEVSRLPSHGRGHQSM